VPIRNRTLIGAGFTWPPATNPAWAQRQPATGGTIRPGQTLNLVFGLTITSGTNGRSDGSVIDYSASGTSYTQDEPITLKVAEHCSIGV
jgi:hypothetical protein